MLKQLIRKVKRNVMRRIYLMLHCLQRNLLKWQLIYNGFLISILISFNLCLDYILDQTFYLILGFSCRAYCWYNSLISRWTFLIHSIWNTESSSAADCIINRRMFIICLCNSPHLPLKHYCFKEPIYHKIYDRLFLFFFFCVKKIFFLAKKRRKETIKPEYYKTASGKLRLL